MILQCADNSDLKAKRISNLLTAFVPTSSMQKVFLETSMCSIGCRRVDS